MARDYQRLWNGVTSSPDKVEAVSALGEILTDKEGRDFISCLGRKQAELCTKILDHGIAECNLKPAEKGAFLITLGRLAERYQLLPDRIRITEGLEVRDEILAFGGFGDVRRGTYAGHNVAVKTTRIPVVKDLQRIRKRFYKEVVSWGTLFHPNILKLVGAQEDMRTRQFVTVSEWMLHGTIMEYIENYHSNRLELLHGAAQGLKYLHSVSFAHGNLKGANVLMSNDTPPRACLSGFGFITVVLDPNKKLSCSAQVSGGTITFMAPELLVPEMYGMKGSKATPQADIYAFGMAIYQVLTGEIPFPEIQDTAMGYHVLRGKRPDRPENAPTIGFSDSLWDFTQRCWDGKIELRPGAGEVVTHLGEAAVKWDGLMPPYVQTDNVASCSEEETSDSEFDGLFLPSSSDFPESPVESETGSRLFNRLSIPPAQRDEQSQRGSREAITKLFGKLKT